MKVSYQTRGGRIKLETEVQHVKGAFDFLASLQEIFEELGCGVCNSARIRLDKREVTGFVFYHLKCAACGARLDFGQHKVGETLFAKRVDDNGKPIGAKGWYKFVADPNSK